MVNLEKLKCLLGFHKWERNLNSLGRYKYQPSDNLVIFGGTKFPVICIKCGKETEK